MAEAQAARERLTPLRVARALATIPIELQHEGLSLLTLQVLIAGALAGPRSSG
jgi:hypothetical protein